MDDAVISLTEVKHNIPIDDARFVKPTASGKATPPPDNLNAAGKDVQPIPFELSDNHIHLQIKINGSGPFSFVLDTGAGVCVISERRAAELGLKLRDLGELDIGTGEANTKVAVANDVSFSLPGVEILTERAIVISLDSLEGFFGHPIDGLLGSDVFKRYVVEIDYAARTIRLFDPKKYGYSGSGTSIPFRLVGNVPIARGGIGLSRQPSIEGEFEIDTGMSTALILRTPFVKKHNLVASSRKTFPSIDVGVGGESKVIVGRVPVLQFGSFAIEAPVTFYSQAAKGELAGTSSIGIIGGEILRRFTVIFDYSRKRMILEPNANLADPYEHDMSGALLIADGKVFKTFKVHRVFESSPATEAGLREGDVIVAIDDKPSRELTLKQVKHMFKLEGHEYLLSVRRNGEMLKAKIKIRRLV